MAGIRIEGNTSGTVAEVDTDNQLKVVTGTNTLNDPGAIGATRFVSENDRAFSDPKPMAITACGFRKI
jgi:hypothetical protein